MHKVYYGNQVVTKYVLLFLCTGATALIDRGTTKEEHLLVSKALPIFLPPHYFSACSDVSLLYEAYDFSSQSEV